MCSPLCKKKVISQFYLITAHSKTNSGHSYVVAVCDNKDDADALMTHEYMERGGKYEIRTQIIEVNKMVYD